jgi:anti-sigma factor RsiW
MSLADQFRKVIADVERAGHWLLQSGTSDVTCVQVTELIASYLAGALDPDLALAFAAHLRGCDDCVAFINTYNQTIDAVQALRDEDVPAEMEARVREFLEMMTQRHPANPQPLTRSTHPMTDAVHPIIARISSRLRRLARDSQRKRMMLIPWFAGLIF